MPAALMPERPSFFPSRLVAAILLAAAALPAPAFALSEIQREDLPAAAPGEEAAPVMPETPGEADPELLEPPASDPAPAPTDEFPTDATPRKGEPKEEGAAAGVPDTDAPPPQVLYDLELLPEPVRRMRQLIVEACRSGDIETLRPLIETGEDGTQLSFGGAVGDPIEFLREASGDDQGHEILAIMLEVLDAGYVRVDPRSPNELYVWPYFFAVPIDRLEPRQRVELFELVTAGDYEDMKAFGAYHFYRLGITPEGRWAFFVAGD